MPFGSKGRSAKALIKMLNKEENYGKKGYHETIEGRKKVTAICAWTLGSKEASY